MNSDDPTPERQKEIHAAIGRMADKLVRLGYASRVATHDSGNLQVLWNARGIALKKEVARIFESVSKGEAFDFDELQAFLIVLSMES